MKAIDNRPRRRKIVAALTVLPVLVGGALIATGSSADATTPSSSSTKLEPCDIYAQGGTPCVAAHSTTRALYAKYDGALYQVKRASDGATLNIKPIRRGGYANAAAQDAFCTGTSCVITTIFDQSGHGNELTEAPPGGFNGPAAGGYDNLADASAAPVKVHGHEVYGVYVAPGTGYRNNNTTGIATGDEAEGEYALLDGTHYNRGCCFDYGNAETDSHDDGNGTMEAIYFGNSSFWGAGKGSGPWVMADLENGLFSGVHTQQNNNDPSVHDRFLTAIVDGGPDEWSIRGGDAQTGQLDTYYHGARPEADGYDPMKKQGAIILGIGGDNSNGSAGTFYEGAMTSGYPTEATEDAVQANIASMKYTAAKVALQPGPRVFLEATGAGGDGTYAIADVDDDAVHIDAVSTSSAAATKQAAKWVETAGLADPKCVSFESVAHPGYYIRHYGFVAKVEPNDDTAQFAQDATFCPTPGNSGTGTSFQSVNYPAKYLRAYEGALYVAADGGSNAWDTATDWSVQTSWLTKKHLGN